MRPSTWVANTCLANIAAVLHKDLLVEFRTRAALNALFLFAICSLVVVSFTVTPAALEPDVKAALLWVVLFFSAMTGLAKSFVYEEETHTADALRMAAGPEAVFGGKLLANLAILVLIEVLLVPLFVGLLEVKCGNWPLFLAALALGSLGIAAGSTICAALVSKARSGSALYAVICLPILLPVLIAAVGATTKALTGVALTDAAGELRILVSYAGIVITASAMLFEYVWLP